jgi:hypothetical protein
VKLEVESVADLEALRDVFTLTANRSRPEELEELRAVLGGTHTRPEVRAVTVEDLGGDRSVQCLQPQSTAMAGATAMCTLPRGHTGRHCAVGFGGGVTW